MSQEQDSGAVPDASTISTLKINTDNLMCLWWGRTRIDWLVKGERDYRDVSTVIANKTIDANENFALAA